MELSTLFTQLVPSVILGIDLLVRIWLLIQIPKKRKPTAAMAWLLLIFIAPVFGTILFFILGNTKLSRVRRREQEEITRILHFYTHELEKSQLIQSAPAPYNTSSTLATQLTGLAPTTHNDVTVLTGYEAIIKAIIASINNAQHYVYVEFYILALDTTTEPFFAALEAAKKRGVAVYVLFDAWGSHKFPRHKEMTRHLSSITDDWHTILPLGLRFKKYNRPDLRNHRKIVVIDNSSAYIGSLNMVDKRYHRKDDISYIELAVRLKGPSVNNAAAVFASDWYSETKVALRDFVQNSAPAESGSSLVQLVPSGPSYPYQNNLKVFVSLIYSAKVSVTITNPYLVPDESLLSALISAAKRGVKVSILNSEAIDQWLVAHAQRSYYSELLEAGVEIALYKKPQLVHEKYIAIDEDVAIIGSSNLDIRSFELNLECVVVVYEQKIARQLVRRHHELLKNARHVHLKQWKKRSGWQNFLDSIARLTSALQ